MGLQLGNQYTPGKTSRLYYDTITFISMQNKTIHKPSDVLKTEIKCFLFYFAEEKQFHGLCASLYPHLIGSITS